MQRNIYWKKVNDMKKTNNFFTAGMEIAVSLMIVDIIVKLVHERTGISMQDIHEEFEGITQQIKMAGLK